MVALELLFYQLLQPAFTGAIMFTLLVSSIAYVFSQLFLSNKPQAKSLIYLAPLFAALAILLVIPDPLTMFSWTVNTPAGVAPRIVTISAPHPPTGSAMFSIFGVLSLIGLTASIGYLIVMYTVGDQIVSRLCGVILLTKDEDAKLFALVNRLANRMQVPRPKIGFVEDLRPNAFVFGRGRKLTLVCSMGLLDLLDEREMEAALAHELAHVRNRDFNFKALTSALKIASFYNPLVYLLSSAVSRQREILCDDVGSRFLKHPEHLGKALLKIAEASLDLSPNRFKWQIASSLFIVSPTRKMSTILSSHPPIVNRLSHLIEREDIDQMNLQQILLLFASFTFLAIITLGAYQSSSSFNLVNFGNQNIVFAAPSGSGQTIAGQILTLSFIPFPLQPFSMQPFSIGIQEILSRANNGVVGVIAYQGSSVNAFYASDGIYSLLLSVANISLAIVILIGIFWPTRQRRCRLEIQ
jgi:heat shock protein HtpX